jgi:hypothetical protein
MLMRIVAALLGFAVAFVPAVSQADAAGARKKRPHVAVPGRHFAASAPSARNPMAQNGYNGYYENILDKAPFGSQLWWRVYDSYPKGR